MTSQSSKACNAFKGDFKRGQDGLTFLKLSVIEAKTLNNYGFLQKHKVCINSHY